MLDLFLYDLAVHQVSGNNGVTHGRSYMKDKSRATTRTCSDDEAALRTRPAAVPARDRRRRRAAGRRRALPLAGGDPAGGDQSRDLRRPHSHGAPLDVDQPFSTDPQSAVPGVSYDDPEDIEFWWDRGALTAWQTVPLTLATIDEHQLFETELFKPFKPLVDIAGGDPAWPGHWPTTCGASSTSGCSPTSTR
jgi:hypothetical protein